LAFVESPTIPPPEVEISPELMKQYEEDMKRAALETLDTDEDL
jgi:hypothetical protein